MSLTLYIHPLASFCHKVLIALHENEVAFRPETIDLGDPGSAAELLAKWPVGKIPVLHDAGRERVVPETSIIIEYLQQHYPGPVALLPEDGDARLEARLWDRFFDLYVSVPMQKIVTDRIRPEGGNDPVGVADAHRTLDTAYAMIDAQLDGKRWAPAITSPSPTAPQPPACSSPRSSIRSRAGRPSWQAISSGYWIDRRLRERSARRGRSFRCFPTATPCRNDSCMIGCRD